MIQLLEGGAYVLKGQEIIPDNGDAPDLLERKLGRTPGKEEARKQMGKKS